MLVGVDWPVDCISADPRPPLVASRSPCSSLVTSTPSSPQQEGMVVDPLFDLAAGSAAGATAVACAQRAHATALSPLSDDEQAVFLTLLRKMG